MNNHFTPGPWEYVDATKVARMQFRPACVIRGGGMQLASFSWSQQEDRNTSFPKKSESQANARLIAAAPDLLEALILAEAQIENFYTATATNAKSRDENKALKKLALENVRSAITKAKGQSL